MKGLTKNKIHFFIFIVTFSLILFFFNTNKVKAEYAEEKTIEYHEQLDTQMLDNIRTTRFKLLFTPRIKVEANAMQEDISKYYYNQLKHDVSRNTYNAFASSVSNRATVSLNDLEYNIQNSTDTEIVNCFRENFLPYVLDGIEAYIMDGAKNYWWTPEAIYFDELRAEVTNNRASYKTVNIVSTVEEWNDYSNFNSKLQEISNSMTGSSVYEIVRDINYYIYNNNQYVVLDDTSVEQTAYGALMLNKAVCEGLTQLFNLLCREKGVPSLIVYGFTSENNETTAHAWNYVYEPIKGQWYAVDVTWNNFYKDSLYFMVGNDTIINGEKFSKNHIPGFKQFVEQTYTPSTPTLATEKYIDTITIDGEYIKNIQPDTMYKDLIKEFSSDTSFTIMENNEPISQTDMIKTGQVLTSGNMSYILVVIGDTNGDGKADIRDILNINRHRLGKTTLKNVYSIAADVNKDGKIDIKDILKVNRYRLKKINEI